MLELPKTLRLATEVEVPSVAKRAKQAKQAKIVAGFKLTETTESTNFKFYAEINIDNSQLWDLIIALSSELPGVAAMLFGEEGGELNYGRYLKKEEILMDLVAYKTELCQDTFLEWGLIYNDKYQLIELFLAATKHLKFWGSDQQNFRSIMTRFGLEEIDALEFVDEYPRVREVLSLHNEHALTTEVLILKLRERYIE